MIQFLNYDVKNYGSRMPTMNVDKLLKNGAIYGI